MILVMLSSITYNCVRKGFKIHISLCKISTIYEHVKNTDEILKNRDVGDGYLCKILQNRVTK